MTQASITPELPSHTAIELRMTKTMTFQLDQFGTCKHYQSEEPKGVSYSSCFKKSLTEYAISNNEVNCTTKLLEAIFSLKDPRLKSCKTAKERGQTFIHTQKLILTGSKHLSCMHSCIQSQYKVRVSYFQVSVFEVS